MKTYFYILYALHPIVNELGEENSEKEIFYVGRTTRSLKTRLRGHEKDAKCRSTNKGAHMAQLKSMGLKTSIEAIACTQTDDPVLIAQTEDTLINQYRNAGVTLYNMIKPSTGSDLMGVDEKWLKIYQPLLGRMLDTYIARLSGRSAVFVRKTRERLFVQPCNSRSRSHINPELYSYLSDLLNCDEHELFKKLTDMNVLSKYDSILEAKPETLKMLGALSDIQVAKQLEVSEYAVYKRRRQLNISAFKKPRISTKDKSGTRTQRESIFVSHKMSAVEMASVMGCSIQTANRFKKQLKLPKYVEEKWTKEEIAMLGTMSDAKLSKIIKHCEAVITRKRNALGIIGFGGKFRLYNWSQSNLDLLGKYPDADLGKMIGCSGTTVGKKRKELGIASCRFRNKTINTANL